MNKKMSQKAFRAKNDSIMKTSTFKAHKVGHPEIPKLQNSYKQHPDSIIIDRIEMLEDLLDLQSPTLKDREKTWKDELKKLQRQLPIEKCNDFYERRRRDKRYQKELIEVSDKKHYSHLFSWQKSKECECKDCDCENTAPK